MCHSRKDACVPVLYRSYKKQKAPNTNSRKPTVDAKNFPWEAFPRSRTPSHILNRVSAFLRHHDVEPDTSGDLEENLTVAAATNLSDIRVVTWAEFREHTQSDDNLQKLREILENGFQGIASKLDRAPGVREFFQFKDGLSAVDGVIL